MNGKQAKRLRRLALYHPKMIRTYESIEGTTEVPAKDGGVTRIPWKSPRVELISSDQRLVYKEIKREFKT